MIVDRHVPTAIQQVVAATLVIAPGGDQYTAAASLRVGEQAEGECEWGGHLADLHVRRTSHDLLVRDHDHAAHLEMVVRLGPIAGGEHAPFAMDLAVGQPFAQVRAHPTFLFLCAYLPDQALLRFEIVPDAVRLDGASVLHELGLPGNDPGRIQGTKGLCFFVLEAEHDTVRGEVDPLVMHRSRTKEVHGLLGQVVPHTVPCPVGHFALQGLGGSRTTDPHQHERDENCTDRGIPSPTPTPYFRSARAWSNAFPSWTRRYAGRRGRKVRFAVEVDR